jgi:hypothetical protein
MAFRARELPAPEPTQLENLEMPCPLWHPMGAAQHRPDALSYPRPIELGEDAREALPCEGARGSSPLSHDRVDVFPAPPSNEGDDNTVVAYVDMQTGLDARTRLGRSRRDPMLTNRPGPQLRGTPGDLILGAGTLLVSAAGVIAGLASAASLLWSALSW